MAIEEQTAYNADIIIAGTLPRIRAGQRVTISNRLVSHLSFVLHKFGSPTGTVTFEIRRISPDEIIISKAWGSAADLQVEGSEQSEEVEFDTPTLINEEVRLVAHYPDNVANYRIEQHYQNTDVKASEQQTFYGSSWTDSSAADCAYRYTYTVGTAPTVETNDVTEIVSTAAVGNINVTSLGDTDITAHGVCWNTTGNPDVNDTVTDEGSLTSTGLVATNMPNLTAGTRYFVRGYATNTGGTGYGLQVSFYTATITAGGKKGWSVVDERFHYVGGSGTEYYLQGVPLP